MRVTVRLFLPLALVLLAACGAPGAPEPRADLSAPEGTVSVVGGL